MSEQLGDDSKFRPQDEADQEKIEKALREAQAPWQKDGLGIRGHARVIARQPPAPPEGRYPLQFKEQTPTESFPRVDSPTVQTEEADESAAVIFPFKVVPGQNETGAFINVIPGVVGTTVPLMSGLALDDDPPPILYVDTDPLWLKVFTALSTDPADYRAVIDPLNLPLIFQDGIAHPELQMTWTGSPADYSSGVGYFFLKIADITVDATTHKITKVTQYVFDNLRSLVLTVDSVLILA